MELSVLWEFFGPDDLESADDEVGQEQEWPGVGPGVEIVSVYLDDETGGAVEVLPSRELRELMGMDSEDEPGIVVPLWDWDYDNDD